MKEKQVASKTGDNSARPVILSYKEAVNRVAINNYLKSKNYKDTISLFNDSVDILRINSTSILFVTFRQKHVRYIVYLHGLGDNIDHDVVKDMLRKFHLKSFRNNYILTELYNYNPETSAILRANNLSTGITYTAWEYLPDKN